MIVLRTKEEKERDEHPGIRAYHDKEYDENHETIIPCEIAIL